MRMIRNTNLITSAIVPGPDRVVLDLHRELDHRRISRRIERAAVPDVEFRAVQHALDGRFLAVQAARRELEILMAAAVLAVVAVPVVIDHPDRGRLKERWVGKEWGSTCRP